MEVKLVIAAGEDAGREIRLDGPSFYIGRAEDCHLTPRSDSVSRHHCAVLVQGEFVGVRDLGSKRGTFVNGDRIRGEHELKDGDRIRVGELEFDVRLDRGVGKTEAELHADEPAASQAVDALQDDDLDLDSWLAEPERSGAGSAPDAASGSLEPKSPDEDSKEKEKPSDVVGVWNKGRWKPTSVNPTQAAADALKNLFNRE